LSKRRILAVFLVLALTLPVLSMAGCAKEENKSPVANTDWGTTDVDTAVVIDVTANDTDEDGTIDVTTVTISANPDDGTVSVNSATGKVTYTPDSGFAGTDTFTYTVKDNDGARSNVASVIVTIPVPGNVAPVAADDQATTAENTSVVVDVCANDTDADGTIYTPMSGFSGTDTFTYRVTDDSGGLSNVATVTVTVTEVLTEREQTLVVAQASLGAEVWLPCFSGYTDNVAVISCYEFLINKIPGTLEDGPGLAESWEMVDTNGEEWIFYLQEGVQWHDGWGEFTADDVVFTWELIMAHINEPGNTLRPFWQTVQSVEALGDYTVKITMMPGKGTWEMPDNLCNASPHNPIACRAYVEAVGEEEASRNPIGTGPYKFVEHVAGSYVKFEAVQNHWRQTPYYKYLKIVAVPEESTRLAMLITGEADIIDMGPQSVELVEEVSGLRVSVAPDVVDYCIFFGGMYATTDATYDPTIPWVGMDEDSLKVRKAMTMAINRQEIVDYVMFGAGAAENPVTMFYPGMAWTDPSWEADQYDPVAAAALLAEVYPQGFSLTIDTYEEAGRTLGPAIAEAVAGYWGEIGITVTVNKMDRGTLYSKQLAKQALNCYTYPWKRPVEPGKAYFYIGPTYAYTAMCEIGDSSLDNYYNAGYKTIDATARHDALLQVGQALYDNYLQIPIATAHAVYGVNDKVGSWELPGFPAPMYYEYITP